MWPRWCSGHRRARPPARLGGLTLFGAAPRSPPVPSGPSGALHTGGAWSLMCGSAPRLEARPGLAAAFSPRGGSCQVLPGPGLVCAGPHAPRLPKLAINFACNSPTTLSNLEIRSLGLQRFQTLLNLHPIELHATFLGRAPDTAHGHRSQDLRSLRRPPHRRALGVVPRGCMKERSPLRSTGRSFGVPL